MGTTTLYPNMQEIKINKQFFCVIGKAKEKAKLLAVYVLIA
ncbi:MAG: hypothetical protein ABR909_00880 [Candidatus Bathyarchaeia archaeon]